MKTILIVAAGTGGHLYPGIAVARAVRTREGDARVVFAVRQGDMGKALLEREGFEVAELPGQGMPRSLSPKLLTFPFKVAGGFGRAWNLLKDLKPHRVVGMGGYLSFPVLTAARLQGIPTLIHEQNVFPGLTNRSLAKLVRSVAVSFPAAAENFPKTKTWVSGLPIRPEIGQGNAKEARKRFDLDENRLTFLVFGGSQGAQYLNETVIKAWENLVDLSSQFQVFHVTGEANYKSICISYEGRSVAVKVVPYCHQMADAYAAADFVICRAGASTIAELVVARRPALLVPYPYATDNHQLYNAEVLLKAAASEVMLENELDPAKLAKRLRRYIEHPEAIGDLHRRLEALSAEAPHAAAADTLAKFILN